MRIIGLFIALFTTLSVAAQEQQATPYFDRTDLKVGYFGNIFWNQGIALGTEYVWREKYTSKETNKGSRITTKQLLFNGYVGYTSGTELKTDNGIILQGGLTWRKTRPGGTQYSFEFNPIGYYRSLLGEAYEVNGQDVEKVSFPGRSYYAPSIAFGIGRQRKYKHVSGWYINMRLSSRAPYNSVVLPFLSFEFGQRINFKKRSK